MSVTCQDLLPLKYFERIKLVAGQNGLDRTVTWPYVGQTSSVSQRRRAAVYYRYRPQCR